MKVKSIELENFRNYKKIFIEFNHKYNIIFGKNAQGKTNLIEAIFLCASGRSHRTSKDIELVRNNETGYSVNAHINKTYNDTKIMIKYNINEKKLLYINEIQQKKIGSLMGNLNAVIFSPEDLQIIKEGPMNRRKFIDIALSQIKPSYFFDLQRYYKILEQRNALLREIGNRISERKLLSSLDIWNISMAEAASRIMIARSNFIGKISRYAFKRHTMLTCGTEYLDISYMPSINIGEHKKNNENDEKDSINFLKNYFIEVLEKNADREIKKGASLFGPQRDDLYFSINSFDARTHASQGQQRTAILSLKLAEKDIMKEYTDEEPVLLLDDVMSELDQSRQSFLLESLTDTQAFITCTNRDIYLNLSKEDTSFLNVQDGNINFIC